MFADRLKKIREEKRISQKDFAQTIGVAQSTYALYETGKREPPFNILINISKEFKVTTDYLLGLSEGTTQDVNYIMKRTGLDEESIRLLNWYLLAGKKGIGDIELRVIQTIIKEKDLLNALSFFLFHRLDRGIYHSNFSDDSTDESPKKHEKIPIEFYVEYSRKKEDNSLIMAFLNIDENNMKHLLKLELDEELYKLYDKIHDENKIMNDLYNESQKGDENATK